MKWEVDRKEIWMGMQKSGHDEKRCEIKEGMLAEGLMRCSEKMVI